MVEILSLRGKSPEERVAIARRVKEAFERDLPELAALRRQLIAAGMMADNFSSVTAFKNADIDYSKLRDDPDYIERDFHKPLKPLSQEMQRAVQDQKDRIARAAHPLFNERGSYIGGKGSVPAKRVLRGGGTRGRTR